MRIKLLFISVLGLIGCARNNFDSAQYVEIISKSDNKFIISAEKFDQDISFSPLGSSKINIWANYQIFQDSIKNKINSASNFNQLRDSFVKQDYLSKVYPEIFLEKNIIKSASFESLLSISALVNFNKIVKFAQEYENSSMFAVKRELNLALYGEIFASQNQEFPIEVVDNALYFPAADSVIIVPHKVIQGLPMELNPGVLAHEFHHRVFFTTVFATHDAKNYANYQKLKNLEHDQKNIRSRILRTAIDEGLADIFAIAYTGDHNFLGASLVQGKNLSVRKQRDLKGDFAQKATYDNLAEGGLPKELAKLCRGDSVNFENPKFNIYCLGTVVAKVIYESSGQSIEKLKNTALKIIFNSLKNMGDKKVIYNNFVIDDFLQEVALYAQTNFPDWHAKYCDQLKIRFESLVIQGRIPAC